MQKKTTTFNRLPIQGCALHCFYHI